MRSSRAPRRRPRGWRAGRRRRSQGPAAGRRRRLRPERQLLDELAAPRSVARRQQGFRQVDERLAPGGLVGLEHGERPGEEVGRRGKVLAVERTAAGNAQSLAGTPAEVARGVVERAELAAVAERALEVEADDLVVLVAALLEPDREPLVKLGARLLEQGAVRGVADERVTEAERRVVGRARRGRDQLLAAQRVEVLVEGGGDGRPGQLGDGGARELRPDDRGMLRHGALGRGQALEAYCQECLDGRRDADPLGLRDDPRVALPP